MTSLKGGHMPLKRFIGIILLFFLLSFLVSFLVFVLRKEPQDPLVRDKRLPSPTRVPRGQ